MKKTFALSGAVVAATASLLVACGGGGGTTPASSTATPQRVTLQTLITDNLATDYSKVWVTIKKITAVDGSGNEVTLFDGSTTPAVVNLSSLAAVGQFMSSVQIPAGVYTEIRVTLDNGVQLVSLDGATTTNAQFSASSGDFVWHIRSVSLDATASGQMVLDFNLAKFTYDPATGLVTPVVEMPRASDAFKKFVRSEAEVGGTVVSVDTAANTITVADEHLGPNVVIQLTADAVIVDEATGQTVALSALAAGTRIEVKGVAPAASSQASAPSATTPLTIQAALVKVEGAAAPGPQRVHGEGTVAAVNGALITVNLQEASFLPGSNTVTVDVSQAVFTHGQLADVAVGGRVEFKGSLSGSGAATVVAARLFDVEGAPSQQSQREHGDNFAELHGSVTAVNTDGSFSVTQATASEHLAAGTYTVDPSHAMWLAGQSACLATGETVEAAGVLSGTTLTANVLAIEGGCPATTPPSPPASSASGT